LKPWKALNVLMAQSDADGIQVMELCSKEKMIEPR
jgi:hypothetical protein